MRRRGQYPGVPEGRPRTRAVLEQEEHRRGILAPRGFGTLLF